MDPAYILSMFAAAIACLFAWLMKVQNDRYVDLKKDYDADKKTWSEKETRLESKIEQQSGIIAENTKALTTNSQGQEAVVAMMSDLLQQMSRQPEVTP